MTGPRYTAPLDTEPLRQDEPVTARKRTLDPRVRRALREPFTRRTAYELVYVVLGVPLAAVGFAYLVAMLIAGGVLAITFIGLPLIAGAVLGARRLARLHRTAARRLLGEHVGEPAPVVRNRGVLGWVGPGLGDGPGWRSLAYLVLKLPLALATAYLAVGWLGYAVGGILYPVWSGLFGVGDGLWPGLPGWFRGTLVFVLGWLLLLALPWVLHWVTWVDRWLIRTLLGPSRSAERIRDLEDARSHVVDDSAATLRRIERDLHDGAQARLVALAMNLTMARDSLQPSREDLERARELVDAAHADARHAIGELRDLARGIHPAVLDSGLETALTTLVSRSAVPARLDVELRSRPSPAVEAIAYFCVAELLTNVARHSGASQAVVQVDQAPSRQGERLRIRVGDDGRGGASPRAGAPGEGGSGLTGLIDRLHAVDAGLAITSPPGGPTVITIDLPSRV